MIKLESVTAEGKWIEERLAYRTSATSARQVAQRERDSLDPGHYSSQHIAYPSKRQPSAIRNWLNKLVTRLPFAPQGITRTL